MPRNPRMPKVPSFYIRTGWWCQQVTLCHTTDSTNSSVYFPWLNGEYWLYVAAKVVQLGSSKSLFHQHRRRTTVTDIRSITDLKLLLLVVDDKLIVYNQLYSNCYYTHYHIVVCISTLSCSTTSRQSQFNRDLAPLGTVVRTLNSKGPFSRMVRS